MAVRAWIINCPVVQTPPPGGNRAIHKPGEHPLTGNGRILRNRKVAIFPAWIFAKHARFLLLTRSTQSNFAWVIRKGVLIWKRHRGAERAYERQARQDREKHTMQTHRFERLASE